MKKFNLETGNLGEEIAKKYLREKNYQILEQNYETKYAEIDIIAEEKDEIVFVEVKTRVGELFGRPEEALNGNKLYRLKRNANYYASIKGFDKYRVDAICIVLTENNEVERINHYENITI